VYYVPNEKVGENGEEFEAAFSNAVIVECLQAEWPKKEGEWTPEDIEAIRMVPGKKFSDGLRAKVWSEADETGNDWNKPDFGNALGKYCPEDEIPKEIHALFERAREIAGCV
jgi:hypothetical protein